MSAGREEQHASKHPMISAEKVYGTTNKRNQFMTGTAVSLSGFCAGNALAWTSPAFEYLLETEPDNMTSNITDHIISDTPPGFKISTTEEATVSAILMLGGLLFAIPSGKFADMFGRKLTLILIVLLYFANFVMIALAKNIMVLIVARFFAGLALGGCCVVTPMYIGEIAEESLRGILGSLFGVMIAIGVLYTNIIGLFTNWIWLSIALAIPALLTTVIMIFFPDSPVYLVTAQRFGKARRALMFLRGNETIVCDELMQIQKQLAEYTDGVSFWDLISTKSYRKPLIAGLGVFIYQQFCGINVVVFYIVPIFKACGTSINPMIAATITNFISLIIGIISVFIIEKRDRKYFLMLSGVSMLVATVGLGLFFHLKDFNVSFPGLQLLPLSSVVLFMAAFAIGMGPVPWILLIELYSIEVRGSASGLNIVVSWLTAFMVTFSYPYMLEIVGTSWTFYMMGLFNLLGVGFIWLVVPETRVHRNKENSPQHVL